MTARPFGFIVFLLWIAGIGQAAAADLQAGLGAWRTNHIAEAELALRAVVDDPNASAPDHAGALRALGQIDWLVRGETDAIAAALAQTPAGSEHCVTAALAARIFREAGAAMAPLGDAEAEQCLPDGADALHVELARTHLALAAATPSERPAHLVAAATQLGAIDAAARGAPKVAGTLLSLALAERDANSALAAWRGYYWLTETDAPQAMGAYAGHVQAILNAGLAQNAPDTDVIALVSMLILAGFTDDARLLADQTGIAARVGDNLDWRRAEAYFTFEQKVRALTLRANREMAGGGHATGYEGEIRAAMGQLMQSAGLSGDPRIALAAAYGIFGSLGETGGFPSLHGGHLVQDEHIAVEQYGRRGELRFIVIDNMVANGYESWLWDGWAQAGGWSGDDAIVQVRSAYTSGPLGALRRAHAGPTRDRFLAHIDSTAAAEHASLGRDGVAALPSTGGRLELQAIDQIATRTGGDNAAFIAEFWRATNQYSIELHEGRHALDKATRRHFSDTQLEFNAKLSQIALADYPRMGLANVADSTVGDTPHGRANRRVLGGFRDWMGHHAAEISGYDHAQPALTQLHLLSDDQIRAAARDLDADAR